MTLTSLRVENYRGFADYRLNGLARVNLLTGKNNSGKTSVLEAVRLLASRCDPDVLSTITAERGERVAIGDGHDLVYCPDISHLFYGHEIQSGAHFRIIADDNPTAAGIRVRPSSELKPGQLALLDSGMSSRLGDILSSSKGLLGISFEGNSILPSEAVFPILDNGAMLLNAWQFNQFNRIDPWKVVVAPNVVVIGTDTAKRLLLGRMWNRTIAEGREGEVIQAMKIIEPDLADLFFLSDEGGARSDPGEILVAFEDRRKRRVPLGSFGEGMRRLLALSLSLSRARGGYLLVDEIDTGLHHSILGKMWHLVVTAAKRFDIQVFATTHSLDCLRGLNWLCENHPDLADQVSVQKIERGIDEAIALDSEDIRIAIEQEIEMR